MRFPLVVPFQDLKLFPVDQAINALISDIRAVFFSPLTAMFESLNPALAAIQMQL